MVTYFLPLTTLVEREVDLTTPDLPPPPPLEPLNDEKEVKPDEPLKPSPNDGKLKSACIIAVCGSLDAMLRELRDDC